MTQSKMTQTDGEIYHILGLEESIWWKQLYYPSNLQIQGNLYQTANGILHSRTRTKYFTMCIETQKTLNNQRNLEKEKGSWRNQAPWLKTILQSYSPQESMVQAQKQKYRSMEQDRKCVGLSVGTLSLTVEARIYNGEKISRFHSSIIYNCQHMKAI